MESSLKLILILIAFRNLVANLELWWNKRYWNMNAESQLSYLSSAHFQVIYLFLQIWLKYKIYYAFPEGSPSKIIITYWNNFHANKLDIKKVYSYNWREELTHYENG